MTRPASSASRLMIMAAGIAGMMFVAGGPASAQNGRPQVPQGWFKACSKQQDVDICNVQNITMARTGQLVTGVSLIELKGKVNRRVFQVSVPTGRMVQPGITIQIDGGKAQKVDYAICLPDRCVAEAPLNDQLVEALKRGQKMTLTSINFKNRPNPVTVSLSGFTDAYDGPPLKQADLEARQKQLQEYVAKNNEDFAKKLKAEQEKAKAAK